LDSRHHDQVGSTKSGAALPHLISELDDLHHQPCKPEKPTELEEMVEMSESMAGKKQQMARTMVPSGSETSKRYRE